MSRVAGRAGDSCEHRRIAKAMLRYSDHFEIEKAEPQYDDPTVHLSIIEDIFRNSSNDIGLCARDPACPRCDGTLEDCDCLDDCFHFVHAKSEMHSNCIYSIDFRIRGDKKPRFKRGQHIRAFSMPKKTSGQDRSILEIQPSAEPPRLCLLCIDDGKPIDFTLLEPPTLRGHNFSCRFDYMSGVRR